jgi:hypothetical protein
MSAARPVRRSPVLAATVAVAAAAALAGCAGVAADGAVKAPAKDRPAADGAVKPPGKARAAATARTLYVDAASAGGQCSDARSAAQAASPATPWCTLGRAAAAAPSGATVLVGRGSYPHLTISGRRRAATVTLRAAPGEAVALGGVTVTGSRRFRLQGFRIGGQVNLIQGSRDIELRGNDMTVSTHVLASSRLRFISNHIHDLPGPPSPNDAAVGLWIITGNRGPIRDVLIRGNRFERLPNDGVETDADDVTIDRNTFTQIKSPDNDYAHADVIQSLGTDGMTITRNYASDNDSGVLISSAKRVHGWRVESNVFVRSGSWPLQLDNELDDLRLVNNTFWDNAGPAMLRWDDNLGRNRKGFVVVNNIFNRIDIDDRLKIAVEDYNIVHDNPFDSRWGRHTRVGRSPRFADPAHGDYRLARGSLGIDAGTSGDGAPAHDRAGRPRRNDRAVRDTGGGPRRYYDIGAYEFG